MSNDKLKQLIEAFASVGYEIGELEAPFHRVSEYYCGNIKILILPISETQKPLSNKILIKLVEILFSLGYEILEYNIGYKKALGDIILVLQTI